MNSTLNTISPPHDFDIREIRGADPRKLIAKSEEEYQRRLEDAAEGVIASGARLVLLTGPSSSGKTTTLKRLGKAIEEKGRHAVALSLDDFSRIGEGIPEYYNGTPFFEGVKAINTDRLHSDLHSLFETGRAVTPTFDFVKKHKTSEGETVEIGPDDIVMVEGIQALVPETSRGFEDIKQYRIYAGIRGRYSSGVSVIIDEETVRFIRRLVRDAYFRKDDADRTYDIWCNVCVGNEINIWPYLGTVDKVIDTSMEYEPSVIISRLRKLYNDPELCGSHREDIGRLIELYGLFPEYDPSLVPADSMLREFIGGLEL
ncbi:MAG: uridine kinase family protein [Oscillospiraceae bacterium]|jgi:uridine kinase